MLFSLSGVKTNERTPGTILAAARLTFTVTFDTVTVSFRHTHTHTQKKTNRGSQQPGPERA